MNMASKLELSKTRRKAMSAPIVEAISITPIGVRASLISAKTK
jgi:hypothetical protein